MSQIHAPYHFVPLSKWVYMPDWAHLVSHDFPFEDGYSGKIQYTLTNTTDLCVGGEQEDRTADKKPTMVKWARTPDGKPIIPGSSIKGMLRNVLEVATFGKFGNIDDDHFSYRDFSNAKAAYLNEMKRTDCQAYWLKYDIDTNQWQLRKAKYAKLYHADLNKHKGIDVRNLPQDQTVKDKYDMLPLAKAPLSFNIKIKERKNRKPDHIATDLGEGEHHGHPVFTGFRLVGSLLKVKDKERFFNFCYMFYDAAPTPEKRDGVDKFAADLFANHDEELVEYLKRNPHPQYGIPVFARIDKNKKIVAFGFAQMPRRIFDKSVGQTANEHQKAAPCDAIFDVAELMFGTLRDEGLSLKSRVFISDAKCTQDKKIRESAPVILGGPKASYLNAYLEHPNAKAGELQINHPQDWSQYDKNSRLAGWKRYPAQQALKCHIPENLKDKHNVQNQLELMPPEAKFEGQIIFHNLKVEELGALLWALQLGTTPDHKKYYHSLGHGKSLGAGAVQLTITDFNAMPNDIEQPQLTQSDQLIEQFMTHMNDVYPGVQGEERSNWQQSPQLEHLLAFADRADNKDKNLTYMELSSNDDKKTTYASSVKGQDKQVLQGWDSQGETLTRKELLNTKEKPMPSLGKGRLAALLGDEATRPQYIKEELAKQTEQAEAVEQQKAEAELVKLPPLEQEYMRLERGLAPYFGVATEEAKQNRRDFYEKTATLLNQFIENDVTTAIALQFYELCKDPTKSSYLDLTKNKKNKAKLQERKAKLAQLAEKYQLGGA